MNRACIMDAMREHVSDLRDEEIIDRVMHGDVDTFECLLDRYQSQVFGIVRRRVPRDDVEEVVQNTFVRAYKSLATFEQRKDFWHWLSKIAVRASYDYWRERYRRREQPMSTLSEDQLKWLARATSNQSIRAHAEGESMDEARELLAWALERLSAEDRAVLEFVHFEERLVEEAAALLGWSTVNVKVRAFRSRKKLRVILEKLIAGREGQA